MFQLGMLVQFQVEIPWFVGIRFCGWGGASHRRVFIMSNDIETVELGGFLSYSPPKNGGNRQWWMNKPAMGEWMRRTCVCHVGVWIATEKEKTETLGDSPSHKCHNSELVVIFEMPTDSLPATIRALSFRRGYLSSRREQVLEEQQKRCV